MIGVCKRKFLNIIEFTRYTYHEREFTNVRLCFPPGRLGDAFSTPWVGTHTYMYSQQNVRHRYECAVEYMQGMYLNHDFGMWETAPFAPHIDSMGEGCGCGAHKRRHPYASLTRKFCVRIQQASLHNGYGPCFS